MDWDLYVDESGSFDRGRKCLIGGFICPRNNVSRETMLAWKREITAIPEVSDLMQRYPNWKYDHCTENGVDSIAQKRLRQEIQCKVLEEYKKRLEPLGGCFVVLDNPSGYYNIDNTTTFLTVLAKGLLLLFYEKRQMIDSLHVHFASRKNVTLTDHPEELRASPTRVMEPGKTDGRTILGSQYTNQIRNHAFLQGGQQLLDDSAFSDMLNTMEILVDEKNNGSYVSNPLTVPCDYICNTFLNKDYLAGEIKERVNRLFSADACLYYQTDLPTKIIETEVRGPENVSGANLLKLISENLPEPATSRFMDDFNAVPHELQVATIGYVREALRRYVHSFCVMDQMAERLEHTINAAGRMEDTQVRCEFICNLLLYQRSLYTHLGGHKKIEAITERFNEEIGKITDAETSDYLYNIADNSWIVYLTDCFDLEAAVNAFEALEKDWEARTHGRNRARGQQQKEGRKFPVYGKTIGSYLQAMRVLIHLSDDNKELYYSEAQDRYQRGRTHLTELKDISRYYQNICDIESEMGHFQEAFNHLYKAALIPDNPAVEAIKEISITKENAEQILHSALNRVDGGMDPFIIQHYARLLSQVCLEPSESMKAETLLQAYRPYIDEEVWVKVINPHARTQIVWKTAASLATAGNKQEKGKASDLYKDCIHMLRAQEEPIFHAIAAGVAAEQIWQIGNKNIAGNQSVCLKTMRQAYQYYMENKLPGSKDPFDPEFMMNEKCDFQKDHEMFRKMSLRIGY